MRIELSRDRRERTVRSVRKFCGEQLDQDLSDFQGVRGSSRQFSTSDRIVVTWYNRSAETIYFTSRISFS